MIDGVLIALMLGSAIAAAFSDKRGRRLAARLDATDRLLEEVQKELEESRKHNLDLKRRLYDRDIEIAQMQGRTDFEPVRMMLKELITSNAVMANNQQMLADKLTISIKTQDALSVAVTDLIDLLQKSAIDDNKLAQFSTSTTIETKERLSS